jgi:hypothetical protein
MLIRRLSSSFHHSRENIDGDNSRGYRQTKEEQRKKERKKERMEKRPIGDRTYPMNCGVG